VGGPGLAESELLMKNTCLFVPAVMLEITQHASLLTVFLLLLSASYN
jgi:hypothetical protein